MVFSVMLFVHPPPGMCPIKGDGFVGSGHTNTSSRFHSQPLLPGCCRRTPPSASRGSRYRPALFLPPLSGIGCSRGARFPHGCRRPPSMTAGPTLILGSVFRVDGMRALLSGRYPPFRVLKQSSGPDGNSAQGNYFVKILPEFWGSIFIRISYRNFLLFSRKFNFVKSFNKN